jgi:(R,R)-butanediol dehydrogenase / meso-butanediol dehydrogenase / diacetyl reductase
VVLQRTGGLAQYCAVPASTCLSAAAFGLSGDTAGLAQPMSIAVHAVGRGRLQAGERALIIGAGGIGAFATWVATSRGAHVTVCDLDEHRLASAKGLGADAVVRLGRDGDLAALLDGGPWDVVYEISGSGGGARTATTAVATGGRIVVVGLQHDAVQVDFRRLALSEITITGTNAHVCGDDLPAALELLAARNGGWADIAPEVLPLDEVGPHGLDPMAARLPVPIKVLVDPWASERRPFS